MKKLLTGALAVGTLASGCLGQISSADALVLSGSSGSRSASVDLSISGNNLLVKLTNTAGTGGLAAAPNDVLTGFFFDIAAPIPSLSLTSATVASGSNVVKNNVVQSTPSSILAPPTGSFIGGWQYQSGTAVSSQISGFDAGSGTAGFGIFNGSEVNSGGQGGNFDYGLISGVSSSANNTVENALLVNNSILLTLSGLQQGFSLNQIRSVRFQYGTDLKEPNLIANNPNPVPTPALLPSAIGMGVAALRRKKREQSLEEATQEA